MQMVATHHTDPVGRDKIIAVMSWRDGCGAMVDVP